MRLIRTSPAEANLCSSLLCFRFINFRREEHRLWVFENRELSRVFGHEAGTATGGLIEKLHDLYFS
jgi:hypothetical protein